MAPFIEISHLSKSFGPQRALRDVTLQVEAGEAVVLVGPNGAGKTTLLRILATLTRPTSGSVHIAGLDLAQDGTAARRRTGFLSHRPLLYEDLTAQQNLDFYARLYAIPDRVAHITAALEESGLTARRNDLVRTFSRGMQQRLSIARALLHRPQLLLLDEPYAGLDPWAAEAFSTHLRQLVAGGCTLLLTTHALDAAEITAGSRLVILERGSVTYDAPWSGSPSLAALYRQAVKGPSPTQPGGRP